MPEPDKPRLFDGFVKETKALEEGYFLHPSYGFHAFAEMTEEHKIRVIAEMQQAAVHEMGELLDEVSWKPWASAVFLHRDGVISEAVDALHFIGIILAAVSCTDPELARVYRAKMETNRLRMINGYSGLEKCSNCKRSFDDLDKYYPKLRGFRFETDRAGVINKYCCVCVVELGIMTDSEVLANVQ